MARGAAARDEGLIAAATLTNPALFDFWEKVFFGENDIAVLHGGRSSSKTRDTACQLVRLVNHVGVKMRVMCIRRFQNRIQESVYTELKWAISHLGLQDAFDVQKTTIIHIASGAEFIFYGIERNLEEIKGTSDIDILWVEEAEKLTEEQWSVIAPTIRKEDSLAILLFNPKFVSDYVWKNFVVNTPPHCVVHQINYTENPFLSEKAKRDIAAMQERDPEMFEHIYGAFLSAIASFRSSSAAGSTHASTPTRFSRSILRAGTSSASTLLMTVKIIARLLTKLPASSRMPRIGLPARTNWSRTPKVWAKAKALDALVSYDTIGVGALSAAISMSKTRATAPR